MGNVKSLFSSLTMDFSALKRDFRKLIMDNKKWITIHSQLSIFNSPLNKSSHRLLVPVDLVARQLDDAVAPLARHADLLEPRLRHHHPDLHRARRPTLMRASICAFVTKIHVSPSIGRR